MPRHLLTGAELTHETLTSLLRRAHELKESPRASRALQGRVVALVFEKPSTRTRVSFEVGIVELGGHPMVLRGDEMQLSRGESVKDTALVLSRHVDAIGVRTGPDAIVEELAAEGSVPVFNMLTAGHHPCQALAVEDLGGNLLAGVRRQAVQRERAGRSTIEQRVADAVYTDCLLYTSDAADEL